MIKKYLDKYEKLSVVAKASFWALVSGVVQKASSVAATPIFTRILSTDEYAQFELYQSWQEIFRIFVTLNVFNYATYTAMTKYENDRDGFITSAQTLVTGLTLAGFGLYCAIRLLAEDRIGFPLSIVLLMFMETLFVASYNLWMQKKRYDYQYRALTILSFLVGILGPLCGVVGILCSSNRGYGRIYGTAFLHIFVGFFIYIYNIHKSRKLIDIKYWKYIFTFCLPLIPHFLSTQILSRFDRIMIERMCSASDVAVYSLSYRVSMLMLIINDAILNVFTPYTYQCIKEKREERFRRKAIYMLLIIAAANLLLILFAPEAVRIFAPAEYYEAIYIIPAVSASVYFMFLFNLFANIEYYYSETKFVAAASVGAALTNVILNYIFIHTFGYIAAGYTTLVSYILYSLGHYIFMCRVAKKHAGGYRFYDSKLILGISAVFITLALLAIPLYRFTLIRYVCLLVLCGALWKNRKIIMDVFKNRKGEVKP